MSPFVPPEPPEPVDPADPPALSTPLPPPEVGFGSPFVPADAENRDRILDWWRMWWRSVFFPWISGWVSYWNEWRAAFLAYISEWLNDAAEYIDEYAIAGYSFRWTTSPLNTTPGQESSATFTYDEHWPLVVGDLVLSSAGVDSIYGTISEVVDDTHAVVTTLGTLRGEQGIQGIQGPQGIQGEPGENGADGVVQELVAGAGINIDSTDPAAPIITATGGGSGGVNSIVAGDNVDVDNTDPANPIVSVDITGGGSGGGDALVVEVVAGDNVSVDSTDPTRPIVSATGGGSGGVESVVAGDNIAVDSTDPANPVVSADPGIPLPVYPTSARPPALIDGDAYFDSTLTIPVWSYGGVWRDSEGTVIPDVVDPWHTSGAFSIRLVDKTPVEDLPGGTDVIFNPATITTYDNVASTTNRARVKQAITFEGVTYVGLNANGLEVLMIMTDSGSGWSVLDVGDLGIAVGSYTEFGVCAMWLEGVDLHVILYGTDDSDYSTYHVSYDGSSWSPQTVNAGFDGHVVDIVNGGVWSTYYGGGYELYWAPDTETAPTIVSGTTGIAGPVAAYNGVLYFTDEDQAAVHAAESGALISDLYTAPVGQFVEVSPVRGSTGLGVGLYLNVFNPTADESTYLYYGTTAVGGESLEWVPAETTFVPFAANYSNGVTDFTDGIARGINTNVSSIVGNTTLPAFVGWWSYEVRLDSGSWDLVAVVEMGNYLVHIVSNDSGAISAIKVQAYMYVTIS